MLLSLMVRETTRKSEVILNTVRPTIYTFVHRSSSKELDQVLTHFSCLRLAIKKWSNYKHFHINGFHRFKNRFNKIQQLTFLATNTTADKIQFHKNNSCAILPPPLGEEKGQWWLLDAVERLFQFRNNRMKLILYRGICHFLNFRTQIIINSKAMQIIGGFINFRQI